jgi:hypothetical protein
MRQPPSARCKDFCGILPGARGPGGVSAAALSGSDDGNGPEGIAFTGFGPYLHEMGFTPAMMITEIDGTVSTKFSPSAG